MSASLDRDQLFYLKQVLGIDQVIMPEISLRSNVARLVVLLPLAAQEFPLRGDAEALIDKMIRAMKLESGDVMLISWNQAAEGVAEEVKKIPERANGRPILIFANGPAASFAGASVTIGQWFDLNGSRAVTTFSPRELLDFPEQKKLAWAHLQAVMKEL